MESDEEDDEVTFVDINDALQDRVDEDDDVINLPPHYRCASHTMNLVSCSDIENWLPLQTREGSLQKCNCKMHSLVE